MLIQGNSVPSTDIIDTISQGGALAKHELLSVLSLPKDEAFISPDRLPRVKSLSSNYYGWHRYDFSGRSFSKGFTHHGNLYDFVVKGGHLLYKGEIYDPPRNLEAAPAWGSETVSQLYTEFTAAYDIQNTFLETTGLLAPIPIPLKVSTLDHYKYKGEVGKYESMISYIFGEHRFHYANMLGVMRSHGVDIFETIPEQGGKCFVKKEFQDFDILLDLYWKNIGAHGSYQYICHGTSMRLADVFKASTKEEMQRRIRSFYPGATDEEICKTFMTNLGKAWGSVYGAGYHYKPGMIDNCFLVDTTIMGHAMDIDGYTYHKGLNNDQYVDLSKKHWVYAEMSYFFYSLFFTEGFFEFYREHFVKEFVDTYLMLSSKRWTKKFTQAEETKLKKLLIRTHANEASTYVQKNILKKINLWSAEKYLGNILGVIGLK